MEKIGSQLEQGGCRQGSIVSSTDAEALMTDGNPAIDNGIMLSEYQSFTRLNYDDLTLREGLPSPP